MFMGEYNHTIDTKGRMIIPAKIREQLGEVCIVTKGLDNCLAIYTEEAWKKISAALLFLIHHYMVNSTTIPHQSQ